MAETVTFERWAPKPLPLKLEAGTPAIAETVAFGTARLPGPADGADRGLREVDLLADAVARCVATLR
jgi:hypothetical protein